MQVVVETLRAEARILGKSVVAADPVERRHHARVVRCEAGVQHALEAGVGHAAVTAQGARLGRHLLAVAALARGIAREALAAVGRRVDEAAVLGAVLRPRGLVPRDVLRARHEHQRALHRGVVGGDVGVVQRVEHQLRVREVGSSVVAVARATEPVGLRADALDLVPLVGDEPRAYRFHLRGQRIVLLGGQAHEHHGRHVVGEPSAEIRLEITARVRALHHVGQCLACGVVLPGREAGLRERLERKRGDRGGRGSGGLRLVGGLGNASFHPAAVGAL